MSKQFYGIKFPFTEESESLTYFDLNEDYQDGVKSKLLHIILTPKGQRLRHPNFGTNLIKFIFESNDEKTWDGIKEEIRNQVALYLPQVTFDNINIIKDTENEKNIYVEIDYSVNHNGETTENKAVVKL